MNTVSPLSWMLLLLGKSILICLLFLVIGLALRHSSAAVLRMWWRGAVVSLLAVIVVSFGPAVWHLPLQMGGAAPGPLTMQTDRSLADAPARAAAKGVHTEPARDAEILHARRSAVQLFLWLWAGGAALMLCRFGLASFKVRRLISRANTLSIDLACHRAEFLRLIPDRSISLLVSAEVQSPFVAGIARKVIVLPKSSEIWSEEEGHAIIRHELAHVENHDIAWQSVMTLVLALLWVNPLAWLIQSSLLKAQEGVADDSVLREGMDELDYAATLSKIATRLSGLALVSPTAPMARQSTLRWRVARILNRSQRRGPAGSFALASVVTLTAAMAATLGVAGVQAMAAEGSGDGSAANVTETAKEPLWTRKYRDTFQLKPSFADRFPGTPADAVEAIRKDLAATAGHTLDDLYMEVSNDKRTLTVEFPEKRAREVEQALWRILQRYSSWDELFKERQKALDRSLQPYREEVEKQRQFVKKNAIEAAKLREELGIIDPDLENPTVVLSGREPGTLAGKAAVSRYVEAKARYINSKKVLEAAELRYSTMVMEASISGPRE